MKKLYQSSIFSSMRDKFSILILFSMFLVLSSKSFAQGNLQFNQVINLSGGQSYTVPSGKCFKMESITVINATATSNLTNCACNPSIMGESQCTYAGGLICNIAGTPVNFNSYTKVGGTCSWQSMCPGNCPSSSSTNISLPTLYFPIWLAENKSVTVGTGISGVLITGIEFNVVP